MVRWSRARSPAARRAPPALLVTTAVPDIHSCLVLLAIAAELLMPRARVRPADPGPARRSASIRSPRRMERLMLDVHRRRSRSRCWRTRTRTAAPHEIVSVHAQQLMRVPAIYHPPPILAVRRAQLPRTVAEPLPVEQQAATCGLRHDEAGHRSTCWREGAWRRRGSWRGDTAPAGRRSIRCCRWAAASLAMHHSRGIRWLPDVRCSAFRPCSASATLPCIRNTKPANPSDTSSPILGVTYQFSPCRAGEALRR